MHFPNFPNKPVEAFDSERRKYFSNFLSNKLDQLSLSHGTSVMHFTTCFSMSSTCKELFLHFILCIQLVSKLR